jgi:hypothetical protein
VPPGGEDHFRCTNCSQVNISNHEACGTKTPTFTISITDGTPAGVA